MKTIPQKHSLTLLSALVAGLLLSVAQAQETEPAATPAEPAPTTPVPPVPAAEQPAAASSAPAQAQFDRPAYTVNPGDVLSIVVWKEPNLQRQVIVRPDGAFSFPLTGDVRAEGKSIDQIRQSVTDQLSKFIPEPVVTVAAESLAGNTVYVIGQIQRPGNIPATRQIDVMQALSIGGGTTPFAQLGDIKILRRVDGRLIAIPFNYKDVIKGKRLSQNILLVPGDVVVVP